MATTAHWITLTYGRDDDGNSDHVRAAVLTYSDVQKALKSLREAGFFLRYFCTGEYGSQKARAHWNLLAFWRGEVPAHVMLQKQYTWKWWKHGYAYFKPVDYEAISYVCKYVTKDVDKDASAQNEVRYSKNPALGAEYFVALAQKHVNSDLSPQTMEYRFPEVRGQNGMPRKFFLMRTSLELYLEAFVDLWAQKHPGDLSRPRTDYARYARLWPNSELVDTFLDRQGPDTDTELRFAAKPGTVPYPTLARWQDKERVFFSETRNTYYYVFPWEPVRIWWWQRIEGMWVWREEVEGGGKVTVPPTKYPRL